MKERMFRNFSLKVLSVVCAIIMWTIIVNINDPNTGYTFSNVTVQLINTESLTDNGYTYEVVDGGKISVYVSGPKSVVTDLKTSDIVATADLSKISAFAEYVDINVQVIKDGAVRSDVEATPKTSAVKLKIDNRVSQNFNVAIMNTGSLEEGYAIVSQSITPNTVRITGSSSLISSIDTVKAVVDISGMNSSVSMTLPISLYDIDDNLLPMDGLEFSKTEVDYTAEIQMTKNVPVKYSLSGSVEEGYVVESTQLSEDYVTLAGSPEQINNIQEIVIPSDMLKVSSLTADKTFAIDLTQLVPNGVNIVSNKTVQVNVKVVSTYSRELTLELSDVQMKNLSTEKSYVASAGGTINVKVKGGKKIVDALSNADIKMSADLSGLKEGTHTVPITFVLPEGCKISENYTMKVEITIKDGETSEEQTTQEQ